MHRRQCKQRVIDAVVGEDDQRTFGAQPLRQDPGRDRPHLPQRVSVVDGRPGRIDIAALGQEDPLRRLACPLLQPVADAARAGAQGLG